MMEAKTIEPTEFREKQRQQWNTAAAGWRKWYDMMDAATRPVSERLVQMASVQPGNRVLDVAAGYGEPALTAARVAGGDGSVLATDISAEMLAFGRERATDGGFENVEFLESDAASLDLPADSFDAALSRWGIIFDPDGEGAAARVRGFLKPGARMAIASWGAPERVPLLSLPMGTAMRMLDIPPPPPGTPGPLSRPTPEAVGGLLEGGGFTGIEVEDVDVAIEWDSAEEFTTFIKEIAPPVTALIDPRPPEVQQQVWDAITEAARERADGSGRVKMSNLVLLAVGTA